jgi:hypothetical protein
MRAKLPILLLFFSLPFIFPPKVSAQVIINEFSSGTTSDWVELYNNSISPIDLSLFRLEDKAGNTKTLSGTLNNEAFTFFDWSNRLDNSGDFFKLVQVSDGLVLDSISYGTEGGVCAPGSEESAGRVDNGNVIERFTSPSKGLTNVGAQINPCPVPTPTSTPTAEATATPVPTVAPTPTPTKKPMPKPTPTSKPEVLGDESSGSEPNLISFQDTPSAIPTPSGSQSSGKFPVLAVVFILSGVGLVGFSIFSFVRGMKKGYTNGSENPPTQTF